jgi:hypothetical protein
MKNLKSLGWSFHATYLGEKRKEYWVLVGKPEGKNQLRKPRSRLEGNIKVHLQKKVA